MCTLIIARDVFCGFPLVVASNRDENPERPSSGPMQQMLEGHSCYAPRDEVRGGTWIGVGQHGIFAALTNRDSEEHRRARKSRGQLVAEALSSPSAQAAVERLMRAENLGCNGFHLVVADRRATWLVWHEYTLGLQAKALGAGLHVVTSYGFEPDHVVRDTEIRRRFETVTRHALLTPSSLDDLLAFHMDHDPKKAACVHHKAESHKTRSSMLVRADAAWSRFDTWHREGPACSGPFQGRVIVPIVSEEATS